MIEYKSGEELGFMKKSPHSPECVSSILTNWGRDMHDVKRVKNRTECID